MRAISPWFLCAALAALGSWAGIPVIFLAAFGLAVVALMAISGIEPALSAVHFARGSDAVSPAFGHCVYCLSGVAIVILPAALLTQGFTAFVFLAAIVLGTTVFSLFLSARLQWTAEDCLGDYIRSGQQLRFAGGINGIASLIAIGFVCLQLALGALAIQALFDTPKWLGAGITAVLGLIYCFRAGADGLRQIEPKLSISVFVVLLSAGIVSHGFAGTIFPQVGWGFLAHEVIVLAETGAGNSTFIDVPLTEYVLGLIGIGAGLAIIPALLWSFDERFPGSGEKKNLLLAMLVVLFAMPIFALAPIRAENGAGFVGQTDINALMQSLLHLDPPNWLHVLFAIAVVSIIALTASKAAVAAIMFAGLHRAPETAGRALLHSRNAIAAILILGAGLAAILPVPPTQGAASFLVICGATLFMPLSMLVHWQRVSGAGIFVGMLAGFFTACGLIAYNAEASTLSWSTGVLGLAISALATVLVSLVVPENTHPAEEAAAIKDHL